MMYGQALTLGILLVAGSSTALDFTNIGTTCSSSEYFDLTSLSCESCGTNQEADYTVLGHYGNALRCRCATGYVQAEVWTSVVVSDNTWPTGQVTPFTCTRAYKSTNYTTFTTALSDGSASITCQSNGTEATLGVGSTGDCECSTNTAGRMMVLVDEDAGGGAVTKKCLDCDGYTAVVTTSGTYAGQYYEADPYKCQACPHDQMDMESLCASCETADGYSSTVYGVSSLGPQTCIYEDHANYIESNYYSSGAALEMEYWRVQASVDSDNVGSVSLGESLLLKHFYLNASSKCYFLKMYDPDRSACSLYQELETDRASVSQIYGPEGTDGHEAKDLSMDLSFDDPSKDTTLKFYLSMYAMNGTWLGFERLDTQFYYCDRKSPNSVYGGGTSRSTSFLRFGYSFSDKFDCDLENLIMPSYSSSGTLNENEPLFYELYVRDTKTGTLERVNVLLKDYQSSGSFPNENTVLLDEEDDVFVYRFMLYDSLSGLTSSSQDYPEVLRYASKIRLDIRARVNQPWLIYTPVLEISYTERKPESGEWPVDMKIDHVRFEVSYSMEGDVRRRTTFLGFFGACCGLAFLLFLKRNENWRGRNTRVPSSRRGNTDFKRAREDQAKAAQIEGDVIPEPNYSWKWFLWCAAMQITHSFTLLMFPFTFIYCTFWFVFYKLQDTTFTMLPSEQYQSGSDEYFLVYTLFVVMFVFQTLYVMHLVYIQCHADVFFVDMENKEGNSHVSVWRRIFVANEWSELQTERPTSVLFTLLFFGFVMVGCDLQYLATPQPNIDDHTAGQLNLFLRFANTTWWFVLLEFAQLAWNVIRQYWPFGIEPKNQLFVDLCSIAKIAVVVLDEKYHGYILHRDGPQSADTTMEQLTEHLLAERSNPSTGRGLFSDRGPRFEDVQCGEMFLTDGWARWYSGIRAHLDSEASRRSARTDLGEEESYLPSHARQSAFMASRGRRQDALTRLCLAQKTELEERVKHLRVNAMEVLNKGLRMFIQKEFRDELYWDFSEPKNPIEGLLRTPPFEASLRTPVNIFFPDPNYRFTEVHFYGIEFDLWLHMVLCFTAFDLWTGNMAVALLLTWMSYKALEISRQYYGSARLSNTSLVDETFFL